MYQTHTQDELTENEKGGNAFGTTLKPSLGRASLISIDGMCPRSQGGTRSYDSHYQGFEPTISSSLTPYFRTKVGPTP